MANYTGQDGSLTIAGQAVASVTAFSVDHTVNTIETTAMGQAFRSYVGGMAEWSGSADVYYNSSDLTNIYLKGVPASDTDFGGDGALAFIGYPGGDTTGNPKISGNVIITGVSISSETEGMVTASISFQGTGPLTLATA